MKSLRELFRIGKGPSSSHTMGPQRAARIFLERNKRARAFEVTLYGSLAATGRGHMTDAAITDVLKDTAPVEIVWMPGANLPFHPNALKFKALDEERRTMDTWTVYSIGGGALSEGKGDDDMFNTPEVYQMNTMTEIMEWCYNNGRSYWEYVELSEGRALWDYLGEV